MKAKVAWQLVFALSYLTLLGNTFYVWSAAARSLARSRVMNIKEKILSQLD